MLALERSLGKDVFLLICRFLHQIRMNEVNQEYSERVYPSGNYIVFCARGGGSFAYNFRELGNRNLFTSCICDQDGWRVADLPKNY